MLSLERKALNAVQTKTTTMDAKIELIKDRIELWFDLEGESVQTKGNDQDLKDWNDIIQGQKNNTAADEKKVTPQVIIQDQKNNTAADEKKVTPQVNAAAGGNEKAQQPDDPVQKTEITFNRKMGHVPYDNVAVGLICFMSVFYAYLQNNVFSKDRKHPFCNIPNATIREGLKLKALRLCHSLSRKIQYVNYVKGDTTKKDSGDIIVSLLKNDERLTECLAMFCSPITIPSDEIEKYKSYYEYSFKEKIPVSIASICKKILKDFPFTGDDLAVFRNFALDPFALYESKIKQLYESKIKQLRTSEQNPMKMVSLFHGFKKELKVQSMMDKLLSKIETEIINIVKNITWTPPHTLLELQNEGKLMLWEIFSLVLKTVRQRQRDNTKRADSFRDSLRISFEQTRRLISSNQKIHLDQVLAAYLYIKGREKCDDMKSAPEKKDDTSFFGYSPHNKRIYDDFVEGKKPLLCTVLSYLKLVAKMNGDDEEAPTPKEDVIDLKSLQQQNTRNNLDGMIKFMESKFQNNPTGSYTAGVVDQNIRIHQDIFRESSCQDMKDGLSRVEEMNFVKKQYPKLIKSLERDLNSADKQKIRDQQSAHLEEKIKKLMDTSFDEEYRDLGVQLDTLRAARKSAENGFFDRMCLKDRHRGIDGECSDQCIELENMCYPSYLDRDITAYRKGRSLYGGLGRIGTWKSMAMENYLKKWNAYNETQEEPDAEDPIDIFYM